MKKVSKAKITAYTSVAVEGNLSQRELILLHLKALLSDPTAYAEVNVRYTNAKMCKEYKDGMEQICANREPGAPRNPDMVINASDLDSVRIPGVETDILRQAIATGDPVMAEVAIQIAQAPKTESTLPVEVTEPETYEVIRPSIDIDRNAPLLGTQDDDISFLDVGFSALPEEDNPTE